MLAYPLQIYNQLMHLALIVGGIAVNKINIFSFPLCRYVIQDKSVRKRDDDDADKNLARKIMQNKQYSVSGQADDEYDYEDGPSRMSRKKGGGQGHRDAEKDIRPKRILTQQERCQFCFENPNRPKHLVVSIANFTYLMLPQWEPVVAGHCCILPMQVILISLISIRCYIFSLFFKDKVGDDAQIIKFTMSVIACKLGTFGISILLCLFSF